MKPRPHEAAFTLTTMRRPCALSAIGWGRKKGIGLSATVAAAPRTPLPAPTARRQRIREGGPAPPAAEGTAATEVSRSGLRPKHTDTHTHSARAPAPAACPTRRFTLAVLGTLKVVACWRISVEHVSSSTAAPDLERALRRTPRVPCTARRDVAARNPCARQLITTRAPRTARSVGPHTGRASRASARRPARPPRRQGGKGEGPCCCSRGRQAHGARVLRPRVQNPCRNQKVDQFYIVAYQNVSCLGKARE